MKDVVEKVETIADQEGPAQSDEADLVAQAADDAVEALKAELAEKDTELKRCYADRDIARADSKKMRVLASEQARRLQLIRARFASVPDGAFLELKPTDVEVLKALVMLPAN